MASVKKVLSSVGAVAQVVPSLIEMTQALLQQIRGSKPRRPDSAPGQCKFFLSGVCPDDCPCRN